MAKYIAVKGMSLDTGTASGSSQPSLGSESSKVKATSKGVYKNGLTCNISGWTDTQPAGTAVSPSSGKPADTIVGSGTFSSTATKTKADGLLVLLENDTCAMSGTCTIYNSSSSGVVPVTNTPWTGTFKVSSAGQTKVKGT